MIDPGTFVAGMISGAGVVMLWLIAEACLEASEMKKRRMQAPGKTTGD